MTDTAAVSFYKRNVTVTTYLQDGTSYIVQINDWAGMASMFTTFSYNNSAYDALYISKGQSYLTANNSTDGGMAAAYALMEIFGSKITVLKAPSGSNTYIPLIKQGTTISNKPC